VYHYQQFMVLLFFYGLLLRPVRCPWVLRWAVNVPSVPRQAIIQLGISTPDWLVRLTITFCVVCSSKEPQLGALTVFSLLQIKKRATSWFFTPHRLIVVLLKNYLKWWAIQLATHCRVGQLRKPYINNCRLVENCLQAAPFLLKIHIMTNKFYTSNCIL